MNTKSRVFDLVKKHKGIKSSEIVIALKHSISRQHIAFLLQQLVAECRVVKVGSTRNAAYTLPAFVDQIEASLGNVAKKRLKNEGLKEHEVLDDLHRKLYFLSHLPETMQSIFDYAFSEMLNNAIEHSKSSTIEVEVRREDHEILFVVKDSGIGVFRNVMHERHLRSELESIQDLMKGKTTTQPQAHSGEGIFFTSKIADVFVLESFNHRLRVDNTIGDIFVEGIKPGIRGTKVIFHLAEKSKKHLSDVFRAFQTGSAELGFNKTEIKIKLYTMGTIYVSRSQARRLLAGLEKFKSIILDFDKVPTIGQAFVDEIFRVFQIRHPDIQIQAVNMLEGVKFMIDRVDRPKGSSAIAEA